MKGLLKQGREIAEKLNEFLASVFTVEDIEPLFSRRVSEHLNQIEMTRDEVLEVTGN